jgi:uncharacterized membrane-anchored protein
MLILLIRSELNMKQQIYKLYERDYEYLHDIVQEASKENKSKEEIEIIFQSLPKELKESASLIGIADSEIRDNIYEYLKKEHKTVGIERKY